MKSINKFIFCVSAIALLVSCRRDEPFRPDPDDEIVFYASIAETGTAKSTISGLKSTWKESDRVQINGEEYIVRVDEYDSANAELVPVSDGPVQEADVYKAIYPSYLYHAGSSPYYELPSEFEYNSDMYAIPLYAESDSRDLVFNSIFAVVMVSLPNDIEVSALTISSDFYMNGQFVVNTSNLNYVNYAQAEINSGTDKNKVTTVRFNPAVKGEDVYLPVPAGMYGGKDLKFTITGRDGTKQEMTTNQDELISILAGTLYTYNFRRDGFFDIEKEGSVGQDDIL